MATTLTTHPEYDKRLKQRQLVRDAASETGVKDAKEVYLPNPNTRDQEGNQRYLNYLQRATYYNFTAPTINGWIGLAFRSGTTYEPNAQMEYTQTNINGDGIGVEQQARALTRDVLEGGKGGILVDYPMVDGGMSDQDRQTNGIMATALLFDSLQILDWSTRKIGANNVLDMVKLEEIVYVQDKSGTTVEEIWCRVLRLDDDGIYTVTMEKDGATMGMPGTEFEEYQPMQNGQLMRHIPFYFCGSVNNDWNDDYIPAFAIADINIHHYVNSADYEDSVFHMQPQYVAIGLTQDWLDANLSGFSIGSGELMALGQDMDAKLLQPSPNTLAMEGMKHKEQIMISLGAKLINSDLSFNTATEALISTSAENSRLQTIIENVQQCMNAVLMEMAAFNGTEAQEFTIDTDLSKLTADPQLLQQMILAWTQGLISAQDARDYMRSVNAIERTEEEIEGDLDQPNAGLDLDGQ